MTNATIVLIGQRGKREREERKRGEREAVRGETETKRAQRRKHEHW